MAHKFKLTTEFIIEEYKIWYAKSTKTFSSINRYDPIEEPDFLEEDAILLITFLPSSQENFDMVYSAIVREYGYR